MTNVPNYNQNCIKRYFKNRILLLITVICNPDHPILHLCHYYMIRKGIVIFFNSIQKIRNRFRNIFKATHVTNNKCQFKLKRIAGGCKIYYTSLRDAERRKESGKDKEHGTRSRRQNRRREVRIKMLQL